MARYAILSHHGTVWEQEFSSRKEAVAQYETLLQGCSGFMLIKILKDDQSPTRKTETNEDED